MKENRALMISEPRKIDLVDIPIPEPGDEELLIAVKYVAVCGSDVKLYAGTYTAPHKYPVIVGHEWIGEIVKAGSKTSLKPGDIVTGDCSVYCGDCYYCGINKNHCEHIEKRGITLDGGCANYICINERHANKCIDMDDMKLLTLTEPLSVAVHGITDNIPESELARTRRALVLGGGGIGMMSLLTLLEYDIPEITIIDISEEKVAQINSYAFPNVKAICIDAPTLYKQINENFDLIIEASGIASCLQSAVFLANPCANIVCLGHQKAMEIDFGVIMKKSLSIYASNGSTGGFDRAMQIIKKRKDFVEKMVTKILPLSQAAQFFEKELLHAKYIKILIDLSN